MRLAFASFLGVALAAGAPAGAAPRAEIDIVAAPTAYVFASKIAQRFAEAEPFDAPRTESASDALVRFCSGVGLGYPDVAFSDRELTAQERHACRAAGVTPVDVTLGSAGIALLRGAAQPKMTLTQRDVFLALARDVPVGGDQALAPNPFETWDAIDPSLPNARILIIGPPDGSAASMALSASLLAGGARSFSSLAALEARDPEAFARLAGALRSAPAYRVRLPSEDPVALLATSPGALVIDDLASAGGPKGVVPVAIDGRLPYGPSLAEYPLAHPVWLVLKREHVGVVPGLPELLGEALGSRALGDHGYLRPLGLIPSPHGKFGVTAGAILAKTR